MMSIISVLLLVFVAINGSKIQNEFMKAVMDLEWYQVDSMLNSDRCRNSIDPSFDYDYPLRLATVHARAETVRRLLRYPSVDPLRKSVDAAGRPGPSAFDIAICNKNPQVILAFLEDARIPLDRVFSLRIPELACLHLNILKASSHLTDIVSVSPDIDISQHKAYHFEILLRRASGSIIKRRLVIELLFKRVGRNTMYAQPVINALSEMDSCDIRRILKYSRRLYICTRILKNLPEEIVDQIIRFEQDLPEREDEQAMSPEGRIFSSLLLSFVFVSLFLTFRHPYILSNNRF